MVDVSYCRTRELGYQLCSFHPSLVAVNLRKDKHILFPKHFLSGQTGFGTTGGLETQLLLGPIGPAT